MSLCCSCVDFPSLEAEGRRSAPVLERDDGGPVLVCSWKCVHVPEGEGVWFLAGSL